MNDIKGISVIIPVTERFDEPAELFRQYCSALEAFDCPLEFIYVLDGKFDELCSTICNLDSRGHRLELIRLSRTFGESAALTVGIEHSNYDLVMTLPAYSQVAPDAITALVQGIGSADMVVARRHPRKDSILNQFANRVFHGLLRAMTGVAFNDIGCGARLIRREVVNEITIYGDQHRFLPILADRRGFVVMEVDVPQSREDSSLRVYRPSVYVGRLLDLMGVFFLARFTKKPLRFFGMIGSVLMFAGIIILIVAVMQKYMLDMALADRPILLLGSLFLVLGVQLLSLGLIGELIIFTHASDLKEYAVAETVNMGIPTGVGSGDAVGSEEITRIRGESSRF
jgi:glycosyltransferase involved in cell wall biosynthesis